MHRIYPLWFPCTVHFLFSAPHASSVDFLCGARSPFCTAHILRNLPVRCTFTFPHRTHLPQLSWAVHVHLFAPYTSSATFLYGAHSPFRTAHFLCGLPVRCTFTFSHRTHLPQLSCAVHFLFSAPHTFSVAFLCGDIFTFYTAYFLSLPARCSLLPHNSDSIHRTAGTRWYIMECAVFGRARLFSRLKKQEMPTSLNEVKRGISCFFNL